MQRELVKLASEITRSKRVVLLGGLAVIGHGLDRGTKDADIWMEPMDSAEEWLDFLLTILAGFEDSRIVTLPGWKELSGTDLVENLDEVGMVRIEGLGVPLDIFRHPNGLKMDEFDEIWSRSRRQPDRIGLPHPLDLVRTKEDTQREHDQKDHVYLMLVARRMQGNALKEAADVKIAKGLLDDFFDYAVLEQGLENPLTEVREVIWREVELLAADGDPFAKEMMDARG